MKILLVLDSFLYKRKEEAIAKGLFKGEADIFYTDYENKIIKLFHALPFAGYSLSHISYWCISALSALRLLIRFRRKYTHIIFINPIVGFFYCMMLPIRGITAKIYLSGFLFTPKYNKFYYNFRKKLVTYSLKRTTSIFVYSSEEVKVYSDLFPDLAARLKFIKYGRDYDIFAVNEYETANQYIASGGISNRDYNLLASAMTLLKDKHYNLICKVATRPGLYSIESHSGNIEFLFNIRIGKFGSFLEKSMFVVLPLSDTPLSAGHMTLLESMCRGKNIIIADIPSVRDYVNEDLVFFYKAGDTRDLADKIEYLYMNFDCPDLIKRTEKLKEAYKCNYNFNSFMKRIAMEIG